MNIKKSTVFDDDKTHKRKKFQPRKVRESFKENGV